MKKYEGLFIIEPNAASERFDQVQSTLAQEIETHGGSITDTEELGQRSLCYPIQKCDEGFYYLLRFEIGARNVNEMRQRFLGNNDILRFLITVPQSVESPEPEGE